MINGSKFWPPAAAVLGLLAVWQAAVTIFKVEAWLLPSPLAILREGLRTAPRLWEHTMSTLYICAIGFAAGVACGIAVAVLVHLARPVQRAVMPLLVLTQNVPVIVLGPLLTVWFGFGLLPKVILITLVCFFPIAVAMLQGLAEADPAMKNYMRIIGAGNIQLLLKLELPAALPHLFAGLKISGTYSVMGAVIAEWLGASSGLGYYMKLSSAAFRADRVFAAVFIIVALSIAVYSAIGWIQRLVIRWKPKPEEE